MGCLAFLVEIFVGARLFWSDVCYVSPSSTGGLCHVQNTFGVTVDTGLDRSIVFSATVVDHTEGATDIRAYLGAMLSVGGIVILAFRGMPR